jgi:hypothetical protein
MVQMPATVGVVDFLSVCAFSEPVVQASTMTAIKPANLFSMVSPLVVVTRD